MTLSDLDLSSMSTDQLINVRDAIVTELKRRIAQAERDVSELKARLNRRAVRKPVVLEELDYTDPADNLTESGYPKDEAGFSEDQKWDVLVMANETGDDKATAEHFGLNNHWTVKRWRKELEGVG